MRYRRRHTSVGSLGQLGSLGSLGDALTDKLKSLATGVGVAVDITNDPYLPETICRAQELMAIEGHRPVQSCAKTAPGLEGGIGLRKIMLPLRGLVYAEQNKWVYPAAAMAVIGVPLLIGYLLGKGSR